VAGEVCAEGRITPAPAEVMAEKDQFEDIRAGSDSQREPSSSEFPLDWMTGEVGQSLRPEDIDRVFGSALKPKERSRETTNGF
jgi:hypothetical protein